MSRLTQLFVVPFGYSAQEQLDAVRQQATPDLQALFETVDLHVVNYSDEQDTFEPLKIEQVRELHLEVLRTPVQHPFRVLIIGNLELASLPAQQAILKILEEPPAHVQVIVTTFQEHALLPTILSRCHVVTVAPSAKQQHQLPDISAQLEEVLTQFPTKSLTVHDVFTLSEQYKERKSGEQLLLDITRVAHASPSYPSPQLITVCQASVKGLQQLKANVNTRLVLEQVLFLLTTTKESI